MYKGSYHAREYESSVDLPELSQDRIITPLQCAFVDACMEVEDHNFPSEGYFARVTIHINSDGNYVIEAENKLDSNRKIVITTTKCLKCGVVIYNSRSTEDIVHPFNGCETVLVEEIMST